MRRFVCNAHREIDRRPRSNGSGPGPFVRDRVENEARFGKLGRADGNRLLQPCVPKSIEMPDRAEFDVSMMRRALALAQDAYERGEVPVGAVVERQGRILAEAHNLREALNDPTAHAERLALTSAGQTLGTWRLDGCTLYVTLEPCSMCAGALVLARVARVVYGAVDPKSGACRSLYRLTDDARLNHRVETTPGILADPCGAILTEFFKGRRPVRPIPTGGA